MNPYKPANKKTWQFAPTATIGAARRQRPINTQMTDQRAATEVMRKVMLLMETVEAEMPLTPELRRWLERTHPKLRRRLATLGLIADADTAALNGIHDHVEDYLRDCEFRGDGSAFIKVKRSQLNQLLAHAKARRLTDLTVERVTAFLKHLKDKGRSHRTVNQHRMTAVAWLNWCVRQGRLEHHKLNYIPTLNEDIDRRRDRRAASNDEIDRLLAASPPQRRFIYLIAAYTGLRRGEMNRIERRDMDLVAGTLTVRSEVGKSKKAAVIPLHRDVIDLLTPHLADKQPSDLVFKPVPRIETFKRDLAEAKIPFKDDNGRQLDFHGLRTTFTTRLLREGIHPASARHLTRHSSVRTLEKHYDKLGLSDARKAIDQLPGFDSAAA